MKPTLISESKLDEILNSSFNPPRIAVGFSEDDFYDEWKNVQDMLRLVLLNLGYHSWDDGGQDYTMADDWGFSRSHNIEIHGKTMWSDLRVPSAIHTMISELKQDYQVVVHHDLFLRDDTPSCYLIIQKECVLQQSDA